MGAVGKGSDYHPFTAPYRHFTAGPRFSPAETLARYLGCSRSMECDAEPKLEEVVTEAGVGVAPDKVRYRGERCVRSDANVIAGAERESGAGAAVAGAS